MKKNISGKKIIETDTLVPKETNKDKLKELKKLYKNVKRNGNLNKYDKWYYYYNDVNNKLLNSDYIKQLNITETDIDNILIDHIIEENDLNNELISNKDDKDLDFFENKVSEYFNKLNIKQDLEKGNINKIFGFNAKLGNTIVSKLKNLDIKGEKGSTIKNKNSNELNKIIKLIELPKEFEDNYKLEEKRVMVELMLRLFNVINKNNKVWYLTKEEYKNLYDL